MKHYPHHIGDFNQATRHLTRLERSVYRDLIDLYYDTEQQLPLDVKWICRKILANSNEESTAVEQTLNEFFTETPTGWYHDRCEAEIEHYRTNASQKAIAGRASAAAKAAKKERAINGKSTDVATPVEQTNNGTPTNQNQEPVTSNQEPIKKKKEKSAEPPLALPEWIDSKHWQIWSTCPSRRGKTNAQNQLAIDKLAKWRDEGLDYAGALENAATGGYQGLFLPDKSKNFNGNTPPTNKQIALEQRNRKVAEQWASQG